MFMLHEPFEPKGDNLRFEFEEGQKLVRFPNLLNRILGLSDKTLDLSSFL